MNTIRWPRLGLRQEVLILLPVATAILILLGAFTLSSYRTAVQRLVQERRAEAVRIANDVAEGVWGAQSVSPDTLRDLAPGSEFVGLVEASGKLHATTGELEEADLAAPLRGTEPIGALALGPDERLPDRVAVFRPVLLRGGTGLLRLDLPAAELARQQANLRILTWTVLPVSLAITILLLVFKSQVLTPWGTLLEKASVAGGDRRVDQDEASFLIATVEKALTKLTEVDEPDPADDIAALERTLGPSLQSGLLLLDLSGRVLALNEIGATLLGLSRADHVESHRELLASYPALVEILDAVLAGNRPVRRMEIEIDTPAGTKTLGLTVHPLRRDDGTVRVHLTLFVDLTEIRRRADEDRLARSLSQVGELAAGMAHEVRNSLAILRGYLTLIERRRAEDSVNDYLDEIRRESEHLERVLEDFLSFARPGSRRLEDVYLVSLISRAAEDPTLEGMPVEVLPGEMGEVVIKGDVQLLERAIRNLLHNAAQAEREAGNEGPLSVGIDRGADGIEIDIADRGVGISDEMKDRLFQPFATSRAQGVGLGLALAHRIVSLHGGRLNLENRTDGGARAILHFPTEPAAAEDQHPQETNG